MGTMQFARLSLLSLISTLTLFTPLIDAACSPATAPSGSASSTFWMADPSVHTLGKSSFNTNTGYKVFRNVVTDFHAVGNGIADDTAAINNAINATGRCGQGCNSSTITPAIIYFPRGKYRVTSPIIPFYFTSLVGDFNSPPTLVADANFNGIAVIDADPYIPGAVGPDGNGVNWWTNQNNFFRSIRNINIDTTAMPASVFGTGLHWQVGQATSLINMQFSMSTAAGNKHQGIFMENGSGGFMSDLTFNGGAFGMWISNQQFTIRNVKISNAGSAIFQQWNWGFTWQNIQISNCQVGFDIHTGGLTLGTQSAGSVLILDSTISNTGIGVRMSSTQPTSLGGSFVLDNVGFSGITTANILDSAGTVLAASASTVRQWFQGDIYSGTGKKSYLRGSYSSPPTKPAVLLDSTGKVFARSRPQYNTYASTQFLSVKGKGGAAGDGVTDDSTKINNFIAANAGCGIIYFDAGTYLVKSTIFVPPGAIIVGEMFSTILGSGAAFANVNSPTPVLKVGNPGDNGNVEISDIVVATTGGSQGAVGIEWNIRQDTPGSTGMWDVHVRLGGSAGTNVNIANCPTSSKDLTKCGTAFIGFHITTTGSGYFENVWVWNADHDLEDPGQSRINAFSARGILVEAAQGPVWLVGTASEHHVIYQYAFLNADHIFAGLIQTETPYFQPTPVPPAPFTTNVAYGDPTVALQDALGLTIVNSFNVFIYGAGLYSFFQTYGQACVTTQNCQSVMALIDSASAAVYIYQLTTTGTTNMLTIDSTNVIVGADNVNGYASTATFWGSASSVDGSGSNPGSGTTGGQFSQVPWNPNPFPSPGAASETFIQTSGTAISTFTTVTAVSTVTFTNTLTDPAATYTTTAWQTVSGTLTSTVGTTVTPASTYTTTRTVTLGSTITTTATVTNKATTVVVAVPTSTTSITVGAVIITLNSGGTPVNGPVPTFITQPSAITPTWTLNILPPPSATVVTFTAPLTSTKTWSSTVTVPPSPSTTSSNGPAATVTGPPGDHDRCAPTLNIWTLFWNHVIGGCMPLDVGIINGITPHPIPPPGWTGPWIDPFPLPTGGPPGSNGDPTQSPTTTTTTTTTTSSGSCPTQSVTYDLPDDPENVDYVTEGTDPSYKRKRNHIQWRRRSHLANSSVSLVPRVNPRHIAVNRCSLQVTSPSFVNLGAGTYYRLPYFDTTLAVGSEQVAGRPGPSIAQEHVFELGYINQFFTQGPLSAVSCAWITTNVFGYTRNDGSNLGAAILAAIDNTANLVWVDSPLNQAKSNVVNNNKLTPNNPPQKDAIDVIAGLDPTTADGIQIHKVEFFLRNLGGLGQYFSLNAGRFQGVALQIQNLLSEITPDTAPDRTSSIPLLFNFWLTNLVSTYPNGCTSRANNAYAYYRNKMQTIAVAKGQQVPQCYSLFQAGSITPLTFNYLSLIPPAPTSSRCNVPGTVGNLGYVSGTTVSTSIPAVLQQLVLGSGRTDLYAIGPSRQFPIVALAPPSSFSACAGVFAMNSGSQGTPAYVNFDCTTRTSGTTNYNFMNFVVNNQVMFCAISFGGGTNGQSSATWCAPTQAAANACAAQFQNGPGSAPNAQLAFFPS